MYCADVTTLLTKNLCSRRWGLVLWCSFNFLTPPSVAGAENLDNNLDFFFFGGGGGGWGHNPYFIEENMSGVRMLDPRQTFVLGACVWIGHGQLYCLSVAMSTMSMSNR